MIHTEGHVPPFLVRWQTPGFYRAGLAVLLVGHVLIGAVPSLQRAAAEHLAFGTDQMVPLVDEIPLGNHAALLVGVDGYVGCDALSLKEFSELADAVGGVGRQRHRA